MFKRRSFGLSDGDGDDERRDSDDVMGRLLASFIDKQAVALFDSQHRRGPKGRASLGLTPSQRFSVCSDAPPSRARMEHFHRRNEHIPGREWREKQPQTFWDDHFRDSSVAISEQSWAGPLSWTCGQLLGGQARPPPRGELCPSSLSRCFGPRPSLSRPCSQTPLPGPTAARVLGALSNDAM